MIELLLLLLIGAFICLWIPARQPQWLLSLGLLAAAGVTAFNLGAVAAAGLAWIGLLLMTGLIYHTENAFWRRTSRFVFVGLVLALGFGLLPGFDAVVLQATQIVKVGSAEYALKLRPDKVVAGFALLAFAVPLTRNISGWRRIATTSALGIVTLAPMVLGAGWLIGYVAFEPQVATGAFLFSWGVSNLFFVTGVEEGFFRGIIQKELTSRIGATGAILFSAALFGLAHFGGGLLYVALAAIAGLGYGVVYHLSGQRIEAAMLTHFGVNILHLLLFTYPYTRHIAA